MKFSRKMFVIGYILAEFFSFCDNLANPNISAEFFSSHPYFFRLQIGGLVGWL